MQTLKKLMGTGILLGLITGMLVSLIDSLYMLTPDIYVPLLYPFYMTAFNLLFWSLFGAATGSALWIASRMVTSCAKNEHLGWAVGYLIPFTVILVYLGLAATPVPGLFEYVPFFSPSFSLLWPLLLLFILSVRLVRSNPSAPFTPQAFIPELIVILLLIHFSANTAQLRIVSLAEPVFIALGISRSVFLACIYFLGITILYAVYFCVFLRAGRFQKDIPSRQRPVSLRISLAFITLVLVVSVLYLTITPQRIAEPTDFEYDAAPDSTPVILIVLDTVRADHLALYGYNAEHPNLALFAQDALVFDKCIANSPWTLPSHASLFTGLTPNEHGAHGVLDGGHTHIGDFVFGLIPRPLDDSFTTLAEIFSDNGYRTMAITANNTILGESLGLLRGFEIYESFGNVGFIAREFPLRPLSHFFSYLAYVPSLFMDTMRACQITERCLRAIDASAGTPFFLFVNYMDAHEAYCPPRPYHGYYAEKTRPHIYRLETILRQKILKRYDRKSWDRFLVSQYDGAIAYLDDQLGSFFDHLKREGLYDKALIIVTSDHGELFGEHGWRGHTTPMYEGVARVPLFIKLPHSSKTGRDTESTIQLHDLFSTVLAICGLPVPDNVSGKPFGNPAVPAVGEFENANFRDHRVIYDNHYKYFYYEREQPRELYNLQNDPREHSNLAEQLPDIADMLHDKLGEWVDDHPPRYVTKDAEVSPETLRALKALGYLQ